MLMGVVKGAISGLCYAMSSETGAPSLKRIVFNVNTVIFGVTQGKQRITGFFLLIDTRTGTMEAVNASHPAPFLYKPTSNGGSIHPSDLFKPFMFRNSPVLGASAQIRIHVESMQIQPGDMIFWSSARLMSTPNSKSETLSVDHLFSLLLDLHENSSGQAMQIASQLIEKISLFFGESSKYFSDDITFAVATISKKAVFEVRDEPT